MDRINAKPRKPAELVVRVRCTGSNHDIALINNQLALLGHRSVEEDTAMMALACGGPELRHHYRCYAIMNSWKHFSTYQSKHILPPKLFEARKEMSEKAQKRFPTGPNKIAEAWRISNLAGRTFRHQTFIANLVHRRFSIPLFGYLKANTDLKIGIQVHPCSDSDEYNLRTNSSVSACYRNSSYDQLANQLKKPPSDHIAIATCMDMGHWATRVCAKGVPTIFEDHLITQLEWIPDSSRLLAIGSCTDLKRVVADVKLLANNTPTGSSSSWLPTTSRRCIVEAKDFSNPKWELFALSGGTIAKLKL